MDKNLIVKIVWCVIALVAAPVIGGYLSVIDRKLSARMQGRMGPPWLQPLYDIVKLFRKQPIACHRPQILYASMHLTFMMLAVTLLVLGEDLLMILFVQAFSVLCLVMGAMSVRSPYSWIGSHRKIIQMLAYEPILILIILAVYLRDNSFMASKVMENPQPMIFSMPLLFLAFLCVVAIEFEKSPFDVASSHHAHQEIVKGTTLEYSGPFFGLIEITHCYEMALFFGVMASFWHTSIIMGLLLAFAGFFIVILVDNICSRMTALWTLRYMWTVPLLLALANLIWLWR